VCEVLRGEAELKTSIQPLAGGLSLLTAGAVGDGVRQPLATGKLDQMLNRLKAFFDCVVVHSHALLTVAESSVVARNADVVLVTAAHRATRMPMLKNAQERVNALGVAHAGVVYLGASREESLC
jgi:Mrp family chromosome partitioning ATPase